MTDLTRDSYKVLCLMYDLYQKKVKGGISKTQAKEFEDGFYKGEKKLAKWHEDDVEAALQELSDKNYLTADILDNHRLTDQAIITMENKLKENASEILEVLGTLSNFVP